VLWLYRSKLSLFVSQEQPRWQRSLHRFYHRREEQYMLQVGTNGDLLEKATDLEWPELHTKLHKLEVRKGRITRYKRNTQ